MIPIVPYDAQWPEHFENLKQLIAAAGGRAIKRIEHIGSTAVGGFAAKPIIDILVEVKTVSDRALQSALERAGFTLAVDEPAHRMFRFNEPSAHVHLWRSGDPEIRRHLLFRDWLRANSDARSVYEAEKRRLAARDWPTQNDYAQAKSPVIDAILKRAKGKAKAAR